MKLIVGLGNPGKEYEDTRHNVGFMAIDRLADKYNALFKLDKNLKGLIASVNINGEKVILLKPITFMNLSGESVKPVMSYYKINVSDLIVINDDLDMPVGKIRYRAKGSAGGHNGLKSIIANLKTEEFQRIKIGIDRSKVIPVVDWVLGKFSNEDTKVLETSFNNVVLGLEAFIDGKDPNKLSNLINS
ncbi:MAG: aminoacyl-tRNA hydrolase [Anaeroplasmataceae bacterium]